MALIRVSLTAHNPQSLALFFQTALGFTRRAAVAPLAINGIRIADFIRLSYGSSEIDICGFDPPGHIFPPAQAADDLSFQHFAIVTPDIFAAHKTLSGFAGWRPISTNGPVQLPASSGGVLAFKFRDPEGHPLELLQPADTTPRIDHTAIVVRDTQASIAFYGKFGLTVQGGSLNQGPEQAELDGLDNPVVEVTRLGHAAGRLHLELLSYRAPDDAPAFPRAANEVAATRLIFSTAARNEFFTDPDGHAIFLEHG